MEEELQKSIQNRSRTLRDPAGREVRVLKEKEAIEISRGRAIPLSEVYVAALRLGVCPYRYLRNREILSLEEQLKLAESRVAVIGAGGLGGWVISLLGRTGVGHLVVVDSDAFDETNLNRQAFSQAGNLGKPKAGEARRQMKGINPGIEVSAHHIRLDQSNGKSLLAGCQVIVDALDNVESRLVLEEAAQSLAVPLVHGALAGFEGQIMSLLPGDDGLRQLYGKGEKSKEDPGRPEAVLGVPGITPAVIGAFEAMEAIKILLNRGSLFRNSMVYMDLERGEINRFRFDKPCD